MQSHVWPDSSRNKPVWLAILDKGSSLNVIEEARGTTQHLQNILLVCYVVSVLLIQVVDKKRVGVKF